MIAQIGVITQIKTDYTDYQFDIIGHVLSPQSVQSS